MDRRVQDDGTIVVGGQVVPTGGSQPTIASVVSYSGNTNLQSTNVEAALDELDNEKAPMTHTHDDRYFTEVEVTNLLASKSDTTHNHDTRYYTESEIDAKIVVLNNSIAGRAPAVHDHDDRYYTEAEVDAKLAAALATTQLHGNARFDLVEMSTDGSASTTVAARLLPSGWDNFWGNQDGSGNYPQLSADNVTVHTPGGYSMRLDHALNTGQALQSSVWAVTAGSVVTVSAWVRGTGPRVYINLVTSLPANDPSFFQPAGTTTFFDSGSINPTTTWQQITVSGVVPAGHTKARIILRSYTDTAPAGTIWWDDTESSMQIIPPSGVVTGEMKEYPAGSPPSGYLEANGGSFDGTVYPGLAALYGDKYGTHSGNTYYLPKKRRKLPDTDWINFPYAAGWGNLDATRTLQYCRVDGRTRFRGIAASGTGIIGYLPLGFRPQSRSGTAGIAEQHYLVPANGALGMVGVEANGAVVLLAGSSGWVDLSEIEFDVSDAVTPTIMTIVKAA